MLTPREALRQAFEEEMTRDPDVFIIGEEVGLSGGPCKTTAGLLDTFGYERVLDTPISEIGFTGLAVGAAFYGLRPVVDFMTWNFSMQAMDHIINSAAKASYMSASGIHCPIVFRGPAGYCPGYAAQHTQEFFTWYGSVPGLKVVAPYTAEEHKGLMKAAIRDNNPVVFLENDVLYGDERNGGRIESETTGCDADNIGGIEENGGRCLSESTRCDADNIGGIEKNGGRAQAETTGCDADTIGGIEKNGGRCLAETTGQNHDDSCLLLDKARILRNGNDVTVVGVSLSLRAIEKAARALEGCSDVEIVNLISLNPIDYPTILRSVEKTGNLVVVDPSWPNYSMAHEISAVVYEKITRKLKNKIVCLTGKGAHVGYAEQLERLFYPTVEEIVEVIKRLEK